MNRIAFAMVITMTPSISLGQDTALEWMLLDELSRSERSLVQLDEIERARDIRVARAVLSENGSKGAHDTLFVHHEGGPFCGSGGCLLEVIHIGDGTDPAEIILQIQTDDVELGRNYENGMRNLRFGNGSVTWQWNGETYEIR